MCLILLDKGNQDKERAEKALQALEKHVASLKKKLLEVRRKVHFIQLVKTWPPR